MAGPAAVPSPASRLGHIDNLRAVAALMVVWTHLAEDFSPRARLADPLSGALRALPPQLNLGHLGVVLFFAISGFVIYGSLARRKRENAGRVFALSRFFRLYPAYWVSVLAGLIVLWWLPGLPTPWTLVAANVTMLPDLLGQGRVLGLYWTLETELVFYALCWGLYRSGLMARAWTLPALVALLLLMWTRTHEAMVLLRGYGWQMPDFLLALPRHLAVMFWGALCREAHEQTRGFRTGLLRSGRSAWALALVVLFIRWCAGTAWHIFWHGLWTGRFVPSPMPIAYLEAIPFFVLWLVGPRVNLRPLRWLGEISYSLYLFHPVISSLLARWTDADPGRQGWPLGVYLLLGMVGTVAFSAGVYYLVERPSIRLGAWLAERTSATPTHEAVETPFKTVAP